MFFLLNLLVVLVYIMCCGVRVNGPLLPELVYFFSIRIQIKLHSQRKIEWEMCSVKQKQNINCLFVNDL
uniref:Secreted protein n=1 Tax=Octopus bimaculoides TaxID=37653 RepID=A0A0L8IFX8_OCTBM